MSENLNYDPQANVDGTPMVMVPGADVDLHGNPYGVTESPVDSSCTAIENSFNSSIDCGVDTSFDNSFDSGFDSFSSGFDDF
ncbi:hypothetical protein CXF83_15805 [Shewanella sp. Choline-02u-19]|uniref:hypothetical protein n=1 Tax=unclassified Shewanella TaxID=196818 RepID=UPI000C34724E|nr:MULTISPECIES: hypothetical protein [unclassified Shewanella]PKH53646.1 hypothetical protein CXF84_21655 [Shewanella sp. Bg11-22]PKI28074.1 hypothetical protein CXF83_15805 [Shewanella sp. Choline-02u-19]